MNAPVNAAAAAVPAANAAAVPPIPAAAAAALPPLVNVVPVAPVLGVEQQKMQACLGQGRLGFSDPAVRYLTIQGVTDAMAFGQFPTSRMDDFISSINRVGTINNYMPQPPAQAAGRGRPAAAAAAVIPDPVVLSYASLRGLKALRAWMDFKNGRLELIDLDEFTNEVKTQWLHRIDTVGEGKTDIPSVITVPKLTNLTNWTVWEQQFLTYLAQFRSSMCGTPLTYVVRDNAFPTHQAMQAPVNDIDSCLVETLSHANPSYHNDSRKVFDLLKQLTLEGNVWTHIVNFDTAKDGRGAFHALKAQAEGPAALEQRKQLAYNTTGNLKFNGYSRRFTFDDYITKFQGAYNELLYLKEPIPESKKVADFLAGITDPTLQTSKDIVAGTPNLNGTFEACQQYLRSIHITRQVANQRPRVVAATNTQTPTAGGYGRGGRGNKKHGRGAKGGAGRGGGRPTNSGRTVSTKHLSKEEFAKLTEEEKQAIFKQRQINKARRAAALTVTPAASTTPTATSTLSVVSVAPSEAMTATTPRPASILFKNPEVTIAGVTTDPTAKPMIIEEQPKPVHVTIPPRFLHELDANQSAIDPIPIPYIPKKYKDTVQDLKDPIACEARRRYLLSVSTYQDALSKHHTDLEAWKKGENMWHEMPPPPPVPRSYEEVFEYCTNTKDILKDSDGVIAVAATKRLDTVILDRFGERKQMSKINEAALIRCQTEDEFKTKIRASKDGDKGIPKRVEIILHPDQHTAFSVRARKRYKYTHPFGTVRNTKIHTKTDSDTSDSDDFMEPRLEYA